MWLEQVATGWRARLELTGWGRSVRATFVGAWLCLWALAQVAMMAGMGILLRELVRPAPLDSRLLGGLGESAEAVVTAMLLLGALLLAWTLFGVTSLQEFLWALSREELLTIHRGGVQREVGLGPLRWRRHLGREDVVDVELPKEDQALVAHTVSGEAVELVRGGSPAQRRELLGLLREVLGLARDAEALARRPPAGWEVTTAADGAPVLQPSHQARRKQALGCGVVVLLPTVGAILLTWRLLFDGGGPGGSGYAWGLLLLTALGGGTLRRIALGHEAWEVRPDALVHVRRGLLRTRRVTYAPVALVLERTQDDEGSVRFDLWVRTPEERHRVAMDLSTPHKLLHLGYWLAQRTGQRLTVPLGPEEGLRPPLSR